MRSQSQEPIEKQNMPSIEKIPDGLRKTHAHLKSERGNSKDSAQNMKSSEQTNLLDKIVHENVN
jgi:hypothetical protein